MSRRFDAPVWAEIRYKYMYPFKGGWIVAVVKRYLKRIKFTSTDRQEILDKVWWAILRVQYNSNDGYHANTLSAVINHIVGSHCDNSDRNFYQVCVIDGEVHHLYNRAEWNLLNKIHRNVEEVERLENVSHQQAS